MGTCILLYLINVWQECLAEIKEKYPAASGSLRWEALSHGSESYTPFLLESWSLPSYKIWSSETSTESVCFLVHMEALTAGEEVPLWQALLQTKRCRCLQLICQWLVCRPFTILVTPAGVRGEGVSLWLLNALHTTWYPELNAKFRMWSEQHREGDSLFHRHSSLVTEQMYLFIKKAHDTGNIASVLQKLNGK